MNQQSTFASVMEENARDTIDDTATAICDALQLTRVQRAVLFRMIRDRVRSGWREEVRMLEHGCDDGFEPVDPVAQRRCYMKGRVALGDGRWVTWGQATVADHKQRIGMLLAQRNGINATIRRHEDAIAVIEAAGVSCLDDIEDAA